MIILFLYSFLPFWWKTKRLIPWSFVKSFYSVVHTSFIAVKSDVVLIKVTAVNRQRVDIANEGQVLGKLLLPLTHDHYLLTSAVLCI